MRRGHAVVVAVEEGEEVDGEVAFVVVRKAAHNAEIQRDIAAFIVHQNIARVHIGVEKAVFEHLGEEDFHAIARQPFQIHAAPLQLGHFGNRRAVHPLHGHHAFAAIVVIYLRHAQHGAAAEIAPDLAGIGCFAQQIELVVQIFVELGHHFARAQAFAVGQQLFNQPRGGAHQGQILLDHRLQIRPQHFHRHRLAAKQPRAVHLRH